MSVDKNVYMFMNRFQSLLANIHVTFEAIKEMPQAERLSVAQVNQACLYTTVKWTIQTYAYKPTHSNHLMVLLRLLSAISDTTSIRIIPYPSRENSRENSSLHAYR